MISLSPTPIIIQLHPKLMNSLLSLTILILLLCISNFSLCFKDDPNMYPTCKPYSCGSNITNVGFPFWGGHSRPKRCGHPKFELICDENQTTHITIMGMEFNILKINQISRVLTIVRQDFAKDVCLKEYENTTLDFSIFNYAPGYENITVLYGCPAPYMPKPDQFTCNSKNSDSSSTISGHIEQGAQDVGSSGCYASVVVPVLESLASKIDQLSSLEEAIRNGFGVEYKVVNQTFCGKCEESKGVCGFEDGKISCFCDDGSSGNPTCGVSNGGSTPNKKNLSKLTLAIIACLSTTAIFLIILCYFTRKCSNKDVQKSRNQDVEAFLRSYGNPGPKRYTYKDLKQITQSFKHKLGEGGYGTVYKGFLTNGQPVAVKLLKKPKADVGEFINEVASIGMTNHVNVVTLLGFCYTSHRRALVYEYMPNGSLEKFVYGRNNNQELDLKILFEIAIGVARGLEYLHRGCNTRILHFDIKPHNILLDENFCPKISDFGLAKSDPHKKSIISISEARGTVGYIAPEVFLRNFGGVSHKSDVYSYGMLVLEMVGLGCEERSAEIESEVSYEEYFPRWIYKQLEVSRDIDDDGEELSWEKMELRRKMVVVSLWCVQINPSSRPSMSNVVEMLEGSPDSLQIPPASFSSSSLRSQMNPITSMTMST